MDGNHFGLLAEHVNIGLHHHVAELGISLVLPCGVVAHLGVSSVVESSDLLQLLQQIQLLLVDGAADGEGQVHGLTQLGDAQVQAGLDQAGDVSAPCLDAVGNGAQQGDDLARGSGGQSVAAQCVHVESLHNGFGLFVLLPDLSLQLLGNAVDALQVDAHSHQVGSAGTGDGVVLGTAGETGQTQGHQVLDAAHELAHDLVGVGTLLVDLHTGMTALEAIHHQADAGAIDGTALAGQGDGSGCAAGAGNGKDALFLGVDVDEGTALQLMQVCHSSAQHTDLLVHSDDDFQRRMRNGGVSQQSQRKSDGDAVIAAQGGALGVDILTVVGHIQALGGHIDGAVSILLADHIHVALNDDGIVILVTAGAFLEQDNVVGLVLDIAQAVFLGEAHQIIADDLGVAGAVGHGADLFKIFKDCGRLQACQFHVAHKNISLSWIRGTILSQDGQKVHPINRQRPQAYTCGHHCHVVYQIRLRARVRTIQTRAIHLVAEARV